MSEIKKFEKGEVINFNDLQDNFTILEEKIGEGGGSDSSLCCIEFTVKVIYNEEDEKSFVVTSNKTIDEICAAIQANQEIKANYKFYSNSATTQHFMLNLESYSEELVSFYSISSKSDEVSITTIGYDDKDDEWYYFKQSLITED